MSSTYDSLDPADQRLVNMTMLGAAFATGADTDHGNLTLLRRAHDAVDTAVQVGTIGAHRGDRIKDAMTESAGDVFVRLLVADMESAP